MDKQQNKPFLSHLHAFRGVAILAIVGAHCWSSYIWAAGTVKNRPDLNLIYTFTETLFHGATLFFALISGLLFLLILRSRGFTAFFKSKLSNVILPYALITLFFTFVDLTYHQQSAEADGTSTAFLPILFNNLIWGEGFFISGISLCSSCSFFAHQ